jgi:prophage antirepressor-like protein
MLNQDQSLINPAAKQVAAPIASFAFHGYPVRIVTENGQEYFLAADVAGILGFKNARQAVRSHVNKADRITVHSLDGNRGYPYQLAVTESGVYALAFGSRLPEAQEFKRWVTSEVLPALRKTGRYESRKAPPLLEQITAALRGRGVAKARQLNRIVAHRDGTFSYRIGHHWARRVKPVDPHFNLSHALREGLALGCLAGSPEVKQLIH